MKYKVIIEIKDYALIQRLESMTEYAIVTHLDKENDCWAATYCYWNFGMYSNITQPEAFFNAVNCLRNLTDERHISYDRMSEIASKAIDGLMEDDEESCREYCINEIEMDEMEMEYFGLKEIEKDIIEKDIICIENFIEDNICYWSKGNYYKILSINDDGYEIQSNYGKGFIYKEDFDDFFML